MIQVDSLEIFKQNKYIPTSIGMVSDNAYLSIVATNACQYSCSYCINSETDQSLNLPLDKAINNINWVTNEYSIKEAIILGGEPTLYPDLFEFIKRLRTTTNLMMIRLTTNGTKLLDLEFLKQLVDKKYGIQGINISYHNEDFISYYDLKKVCNYIKQYNPQIKIRINTNIWRGNNDTISSLQSFLRELYFIDEIRVSNIIPKDSFSVNSVNSKDNLILSDEEYTFLFKDLLYKYNHLTLIENKQTLGFVRYILIPTKVPIIINWNLDSTVNQQVCENNIKTRHINTFKCLVTGDISLSWNTNNIILKK